MPSEFLPQALDGSPQKEAKDGKVESDGDRTPPEYRRNARKLTDEEIERQKQYNKDNLHKFSVDTAACKKKDIRPQQLSHRWLRRFFLNNFSIVSRIKPWIFWSNLINLP